MNFPELNFPSYELRTRQSERKTLVFDIVRKKYVVLTPEEWVRQHVVHFLIQEQGISINKISVEYFLRWNDMQHRCDIVVFDDNFNPLLIVESKSAKIAVSQKVFDQVARYNLNLKVKYLMVTNGLQHFYCLMNYENQSYTFIQDLPVPLI